MNTHFIEEDDVVIELIAETQGEIYQCAYEMGYSIEDFSNKYLRSNFCRYEMDSEYSVFQTDFGSLCMEQVLEEFKRNNISLIREENKNLVYSPKWIGEMYRYLFFALKFYSSDLPTVIPFKTLVSKNIELEECEMSEAVNILATQYKQILNKSEFKEERE